MTSLRYLARLMWAIEAECDDRCAVVNLRRAVEQVSTDAKLFGTDCCKQGSSVSRYAIAGEPFNRMDPQRLITARRTIGGDGDPGPVRQRKDPVRACSAAMGPVWQHQNPGPRRP